MRSIPYRRLWACLLLSLCFLCMAMPAVYAVDSENCFTIQAGHFNSPRLWQTAIDGTLVDGDTGGNYWELTLAESQKGTFTLTLDEKYLGNGTSRFLRHIGSGFHQETSLQSADGQYWKIFPVKEQVVFDDYCFRMEEGEDYPRISVSYSFTFNGEYLAVPTTVEVIRERDASSAHDTWPEEDFANAQPLYIRGSGATRDFVDTRVTQGNQITYGAKMYIGPSDEVEAAYEIDYGNGWESFPVVYRTSERIPDDFPPGGVIYLYDFYNFTIYLAEPGSATVVSSSWVSPKETVVAAVTATAVATVAGAATAATTSAAGETVSELGGEVLSEITTAENNDPEPSDTKKSSSGSYELLVNGGTPLPPLCNTAKATVEIPLFIQGGEHLSWQWFAACLVPDAPTCVIGSVLPAPGGSATATVLLTGKPLPKESISLFFELSAVSEEDGVPVSLSSVLEFTLHEKGLRAVLKDSSQPKKAWSYQVQCVQDSNLDGIAEFVPVPTERFRLAITVENGIRTAQITGLSPYEGMVKLPLS